MMKPQRNSLWFSFLIPMVICAFWKARQCLSAGRISLVLYMGCFKDIIPKKVYSLYDPWNNHSDTKSLCEGSCISPLFCMEEEHKIYADNRFCPYSADNKFGLALEREQALVPSLCQSKDRD
jgi:hypothetical protein